MLGRKEYGKITLHAEKKTVIVMPAILLLLLFIQGCGPSLQQQYNDATTQASNICTAEINNNPGLAQLRRLGLFDNGGGNVRTMSNQALPSYEEMIEFRSFLDKKQNCRNAWYRVAQMEGPQFATNLSMFYSAVDRTAAEFLTGQYTWATYGKVMSQISDEYNRINTELSMQAQRDAYAQQQAQAAATAAWASQMQALGQAMQTQQPRQPTTTNCQAFGNQLNCTQW